MDTLLRRGYKESALCLDRHQNLNGLVDVELELFQELRNIENALLAGSATDALSWCKSNAVAIKKTKVRRWPHFTSSALSCMVL